MLAPGAGGRDGVRRGAADPTARPDAGPICDRRGCSGSAPALRFEGARLGRGMSSVGGSGLPERPRVGQAGSSSPRGRRRCGGAGPRGVPSPDVVRPEPRGTARGASGRSGPTPRCHAPRLRPRALERGRGHGGCRRPPTRALARCRGGPPRPAGDGHDGRRSAGHAPLRRARGPCLAGAPAGRVGGALVGCPGGLGSRPQLRGAARDSACARRGGRRRRPGGCLAHRRLLPPRRASPDLRLSRGGRARWRRARDPRLG